MRSACTALAMVCLLGCERGADSNPTAAHSDEDREQAASVERPDVQRFYVPLEGDEPTRGPRDALVTIVELGDFECPYCTKAKSTMDHLRARYGDDLRIVWMNRPLPFHRNARAAATAALEAKAQRGDEGFWKMHDRLFDEQRALDVAGLHALAAELGLNLEAFSAALEEDGHGETIDAHQELASALAVKGTPTFFINGRRVRGAQPLTRFALIVEEELRYAKALVESGIPRSTVYDTMIEDGIKEVEPAPEPPRRAPEPSPSRVYDIPLPKRPRAKGPDGAEVVIQEFSDFQCPVCSRVAPTLERVLAHYGSKVRLVFRDYPLDFHPDAHLAAQAAREVFSQGGDAAFWKYHDLLLHNQHALTRADLEKYAGQLQGIDLRRFRRALDTGKHRAAVDADIAAVARAGARIGTPAFFINGKLAIQGAYPFETFEAAIDAELSDARRAPF